MNYSKVFNPISPYIRACESPRILLTPTEMRDVVFKRHISLDKSVDLEDMDALKALCLEHFEQCSGIIRGSKIEYYELHLKKILPSHKVIKIII